MPREQCSPPMFVLFIISCIFGAVIITQKLSADTKPPVLPPITKNMIYPPGMETAPFIIRGTHGQSLACVVEDKNGNGRLIIYSRKGQKLFDTDKWFIKE